MTARNYQISITVTGYDKASGPLSGVKGALGGLGTVAGGILTAGFLTSIGRQIADLGRQALDSYANYERLGMALQSLVARELLNTGKAEDMASAMEMAGDKAKELQGWITKLAIQSPFQQEDIANSFRLAMAYGFTTDEAKRLTSAMTDFAAGSGASSDTMNRIALALGQIKAKGKLAGQEMLQLTEAGLDVRGILAKAFGKTTEEIVAMQEKGLIPANEAIEAIVKSLENDFGGAAAKQAGTFSGLLASMEDLKTVGLRTFFEGTFKAIQPYLQKFVDTLSDPAFMEKLGAAGQKLGEFIAIALDGFSRLQGKIQLFRARLEIFMQTPAFKKIVENFQNIFKVLTQPQVQEAGRKIFEALKTFLKDLGEKVLPWAVSMFDKLSAWFVENGPLIGAYVATIAALFTDILLPAIIGMWQFIEPLLTGIIDLVLGLAKTIMQIATGDWAGAWETIKQTVANAGIAIWSAVVGFLNWIANLMGSSLAEIGAVWKNNWELFKSILVNIWNIIVNAIKSKIAEAKNSVASGIENIKNAISNQIGNFANLGTQLIEGFQNGVESAFANLLSTLEELIDLLPDVVKQALGIASPSKVFMWLGEQMMRGLSVGILSFGTLPKTALEKVLNGFSMGGVSSLSNYVNNSRDYSSKYYAPVYVTVTQADPGLAGILKGTRSR